MLRGVQRRVVGVDPVRNPQADGDRPQVRHQSVEDHSRHLLGVRGTEPAPGERAARSDHLFPHLVSSSRRAREVEALLRRGFEKAQDEAALIADAVVEAVVARGLVGQEVCGRRTASNPDGGQGREVWILQKLHRIAGFPFNKRQELTGGWQK
jgi:hypothetical protein